MAAPVAQTVTLTAWIPEGLPGPEHFAVVESPAPTADQLQDGQLLLQALVFSADPYLRGGCKSEAKRGSPLPAAMQGFIAGKVLASRQEGWAAGELFGASLPFCTVQIVTAQGKMIWKLRVEESQVSHGIGVLGMPGSTAYGGLIDVLRPEKKATPEVLWVSGAAGAVGSLVGMLAKRIYGCTVVGSCGGPEKVALCKETFGFDHVIDYKECDGSPEDLAAKLKAAVPDGIDMYFDNVGGAHFEAAMMCLRKNGRVAVCGGISHYNEAEKTPDKFYPMDLIYNFQRVEGFMCQPWLSGAKGSFHTEMARWLQEGHVCVEETVFDGIDSWPQAFQSLFTGKNSGKVVVRL